MFRRLHILLTVLCLAGAMSFCAAQDQPRPAGNKTDVKEGAKEVGSGTKRAAKGVARETKKGARVTADKAEDVGEATVKAAKKAGRWTKKTARKAVGKDDKDKRPASTDNP